MSKHFSHLVVTTDVRHRFQARIAAEQILDLLRHHGCPYPDNARLSVQGEHFVIEWDQTPPEKQTAVSYDIPLRPFSGEGVGEPEPADTSPPVTELWPSPPLTGPTMQGDPPDAGNGVLEDQGT